MKNRMVSISLVVVLALSAGLISCGGEEVPEIPEYSLTISSTEGGLVTTPGEGNFAYDEGTVVNLVAEAEDGYQFVNWIGDVDIVANVNAASTNITMQGDYEIAASFEEIPPVRYSLTISSTAGGSVTEPGEGTSAHDAGTIIDLVAQAEEGYVFVNWTGDVGGIHDIHSATTTIAMNGDYAITASFAEDEVVVFADPNLEEVVRQASNMPEDPIYASELKRLTSLEAREMNIQNVSGLEHCTGLKSLDLGLNQISDISHLANLTNLTELYLLHNEISDISPLAGLSNLTGLHLEDNQISDISLLASLTNLTWLYLEDNQISNISPLANLTQLTGLGLSGHQISDISLLIDVTRLTSLVLSNSQISDISTLANLTNLTWLELRHNEISDISPIGNLANLTSLELLDNQISDISPLASLTKLTVLNLGRNQISDISPLVNLTNLTYLHLDHNQISDISPLASLTNLTSPLYLDNNQISDISPLVENEGLSEGDEVYLLENPLSSDSINIYIPQLRARGVDVRY